MAPLLDLTAIRREVIALTDETGEHWSLSDRVAAEVLLPCFDLVDLDAQIDALTDVLTSDDATPEAAREAKRLIAERVAQTTAVCLAIFQASYPEMTTERLIAILPQYGDRRMVTNVFFGFLLRPSSGLMSASEPSDDASSSAASGSTPTPTTPEPMTPTRMPPTTPAGRGATRRPKTPSPSPAVRAVPKPPAPKKR